MVKFSVHIVLGIFESLFSMLNIHLTNGFIEWSNVEQAEKCNFTLNSLTLSPSSFPSRWTLLGSNYSEEDESWSESDQQDFSSLLSTQLNCSVNVVASNRVSGWLLEFDTKTNFERQSEDALPVDCGENDVILFIATPISQVGTLRPCLSGQENRKIHVNAPNFTLNYQSKRRFMRNFRHDLTVSAVSKCPKTLLVKSAYKSEKFCQDNLLYLGDQMESLYGSENTNYSQDFDLNCVITIVPSSDMLNEIQSTTTINQTFRWIFHLKLTKLDLFNDNLDANESATFACYNGNYLRLWSDNKVEESVLLCPPMYNPFIATTINSIKNSELSAISLITTSNLTVQVVPSLSLGGQNWPKMGKFCFEYSAEPLTADVSSQAEVNEKEIGDESGTSDQCPSNDGDWHRFGQYCYKIFGENGVTRMDAANICNSSQINGHLASIPNEKVQKFLEKLILRHKMAQKLTTIDKPDDGLFYWIGATDIKHENHFQWDDGQVFSYTNWFTGWKWNSYSIKYGKQPSDDGFSGQDCLELRNRFKYPSKGYGTTGESYFWNDISCESLNGFVCQKKLNIKSSQKESDYDAQLTDNNYANCDTQITLTQHNSLQQITSPLYPKSYPNNLNCSFWLNSTDNYYIELIFTDFLLEDGDSNCRYDFLSIQVASFDDSVNFEKLSNSRTFCGDYGPKIKLLQTSGKAILLTLVTDESHTYRGFKAQVRRVPNPRNSLSTEYSDLLCDHKMFKTFQGDCYFLSFYPEVSWWTATRVCRDIGSEIVMIRDYEDERRLVEFFEVNQKDQFSGGDLFRQPQSFWILQSRGSLFYTKEMFSGTAEGLDADDASDPIERKIIRGNWFSVTQEKPNAFNGDEPTRLCHIFSLDQLKRGLIYKTIDCGQQAGYICRKKAIDLSQIRNLTITNQTFGELTSPNFPNNYPNSIDYHVNISSKFAGSSIVIWFESLDIEWQSDCLYDFLQIIEPSSRSSLISRSSSISETICGSLESPTQLANLTYFSRTPQVSIRFRSDYDDGGSGFKLKWQIINSNWCKSSMTVVPVQGSGTIQSPGYPDWTLPSMNCSLTLRSPMNSLILLTILDFHLGHTKKVISSDRCRNLNEVENEFVLLQLDERRNLTLCGSIESKDIFQGQQFVSYGPKLTITYRTRSHRFRELLTNYRGFQFKYQVITDHNRVITNLNIKPKTFGRITSINYPYHLPSHLNYTMFLKTEVGHNLWISASRYGNLSISKSPCNNDSSVHLLGKRFYLEHQHDHSIAIVDSFGSINVNPPRPSIWFLCPTVQPLGRRKIALFKTSSSQVAKSQFHSLKIVISNYNTKSTGQSESRFQLLYETHIDSDLVNKTKYLARDYPVDECSYQPCSDKGQCADEEAHGRNQSLCKCKSYYTGLFCHLTFCDLNPCSSNGICELNAETSDYICHCNRGFTGRNCLDTISSCDRTNPCGDRGKCSLINDHPVCECSSWYEGRFCDKFRLKIHYKPLSQRMLEEPFWLGLITVGVVLALISLVYCIKKKFAEKIEKFFEEEIEKSKTLTAFGITDGSSGHRFSITSNLGFGSSMTPINRSPPLTRSKSSIIGRIVKRGMRSSNAGHLSDSEVGHSREKDDVYSDSEAAIGFASNRKKFRPIMFFASRSVAASSTGLVSSFDKREKSRILSSLVSRGDETRGRRMSLDDFFRINEARIRSRNLLNSETKSGDSSSDAEKHSPVNEFVPFVPSSPRSYRDPTVRKVPSLVHFHAIRENSQEDQESTEFGRTSSMHNFEYDQEKGLDSLMYQDLEQDELTIDSLSCRRKDLDVETISARPRSSLRVKRSPSPRRPSSDVSSSSDSGSPNRINAPEIMVTRASVEYQSTSDSDAPHTTGSSQQDTVISSIQRMTPIACGNSPSEEYIHRSLTENEQQSIENGNTKDVLFLPNESLTVRRSSEPPILTGLQEELVDRNMNLRSSKKHESEKDSKEKQKSSNESACRKFSLELLVPQIKINGGEEMGECSSHHKPRCNVRAVSSHTISESNLSTSGYSSLSSPGVSRTNSCSPILDEVLAKGAEASLQNVFIPEDTTCATESTLFARKGSSNYGNFLTIPSLNFPLRTNSSLKRRVQKSRENLKNLDDSGITSAPTQGRRDTYNLPHNSSLEPVSPGKQYSINQKRERLLVMKEMHKTVGGVHSEPRTPGQRYQLSLDLYDLPDYHGISPREVNPCLKKVPIHRNPSWPGLIKADTLSSDSDEATGPDFPCDSQMREETSIRQCRSPGASRKFSHRLNNSRMSYKMASRSSHSLSEYQSRPNIQTTRRVVNRTDSYPRCLQEKSLITQDLSHHRQLYGHSLALETSSSSSPLGDELTHRSSNRSLNSPCLSPSSTVRTVRSVSPRGSFRRKPELPRQHSYCAEPHELNWSRPMKLSNLKKESRKMSISDTALTFERPRSGKTRSSRKAKLKSPSQSLPTEGENEEYEIVIPIKYQRKSSKTPSCSVYDLSPSCDQDSRLPYKIINE